MHVRDALQELYCIQNKNLGSWKVAPIEQYLHRFEGDLIAT
jgi:hypothetical protein